VGSFEMKIRALGQAFSHGTGAHRKFVSVFLEC